MPTCARKEIIRQGMPGIFHCWSRCVRRAWLLGDDPLTGKNYDHRRLWILQRLQLLVASFAIDVGFLAILSNHFHLVLRATPRITQRWGAWEVARRWLRVYPGRQLLDGEPTPEPTEAEIEKLAADKERIEVLRQRLGNVSWFMAALKENISRRANREDETSGHFWESRFSAREILDETSLLICATYVDLNQVRAGEARTPEESMWSSIGLRIRAQFVDPSAPASDSWLAPLTLSSSDLEDVPCSTGHRASDKGLLPISLQDYVRLVDFAGRQIRADKRGVIPPDLEPILTRLGIANGESFLAAVTKLFPSLFKRLAGTVELLQQRARAMGRKWVHGMRAARNLYSSTPPPP